MTDDHLRRAVLDRLTDNDRDDPLPPHGFDYSALLSPEQRRTQRERAERTRATVRAIHEATERLLEQWAADGLPLDQVEPKWEFGEVTEEGRLPVRVWLEWRETK